MHKQRAIEKQSVFLADSDKILTGSVAILVSIRKEAISHGPNGGKRWVFQKSCDIGTGDNASIALEAECFRHRQRLKV